MKRTKEIYKFGRFNILEISKNQEPKDYDHKFYIQHYPLDLKLKKDKTFKYKVVPFIYIENITGRGVWYWDQFGSNVILISATTFVFFRRLEK